MKRSLLSSVGFVTLFVVGQVAFSQPQMKFTAYYPTWMQAPLGQNGYCQGPWDIDWTGVTHIVHFDNPNVQTTSPYLSYVVNNQTGKNDSINLFWSGIWNPGNGTWTINYVDSLIAVAHRKNIKVLLTIQAVDAANLNYVANDSARTDTFAVASVNFIKRHGYDGLEVDWENWITPITNSANVNRFIRRLRTYLNTMSPRGLLFLSPSTADENRYFASQDTAVDMYNLQMYDYGFAWYPTTNSNASWYMAPLHLGTVPATFEGKSYDTRGPLQWVSAGHQASRVGALFPTLGIVWKGVDTLFKKYTGQTVDLSASAVNNLVNFGGTYKFDNVRKVPYVSGTASSLVPSPINLTAGEKFLGTFENVQSIQEKIAWLRSIGMGGVGMYDLKGDSDPTKPFGQRNPLHKAVSNGLVSVAIPVRSGPPDGFSLNQNFPNPFNPSTTISFSIPRRSHVSLTVFNALGQVVATLVSAELDGGQYKVSFDTSASHGISTGVYFYRLETAEFSETKKLVLLK